MTENPTSDLGVHVILVLSDLLETEMKENNVFFNDAISDVGSYLLQHALYPQQIAER